MTTRSKNNIHEPIRKLTFHTHLPSTDIQEPTPVTNALKEAKWRHAMQDEFNSLIQNKTWDLVSPQCASNLVGCKWIFRVKRNSDGSVSRYKARLVAKGLATGA
jgi:histone deacetylase 1/2